MIPIIWGGRGTIEFRCHVPTVSDQKIINWLYITSAILNYARQHVSDLTTKSMSAIQDITLDKIMKESYPMDITKVLISYMNQRKAHYEGKNDHIGQEEIGSEQEMYGSLFKLEKFV